MIIVMDIQCKLAIQEGTQDTLAAWHMIIVVYMLCNTSSLSGTEHTTLHPLWLCKGGHIQLAVQDGEHCTTLFVAVQRRSYTAHCPGR